MLPAVQPSEGAACGEYLWDPRPLLAAAQPERINKLRNQALMADTPEEDFGKDLLASLHTKGTSVSCSSVCLSRGDEQCRCCTV